ncbi:hypothetical protein JOF41_004590 [Saccharothrix coeruleofusca]|uniref:PRC-barrel domain-containing protein n=1 Tax=Saccharothrix coeruleofusca TaxID=33919 RepID=UPI001AE6BAA6|nr:PRC-barrel domain-containing protein [Saccharothrix coeruleofusca]MBP2338412.1 hypothetical protein [Saccharothrix coeruleofusca]
MYPSAVERLYDCEVLDRHGQRIGSLRGLWLAAGSGVPRWAVVGIGGAEVLVPVRGGQVRERRLVLPIEKHEVEGAPAAQGDSLDVARVHDHYRLTASDEQLVRHERAAGVGAASVSAASVSAACVSAASPRPPRGTPPAG